MIRRRLSPIIFISLGSISYFLSYPQRLLASSDTTEYQTNFRTLAAFVKNPDNKELFGSDSETFNKALLRQTLKWSSAEQAPRWSFEANAYALLSGASDKISGSQVLTNATDERNRSSKLERHWIEGHRLDGYLAFDRLNARLSAGKFDASIGRLPINMSTTTVFTPNDFFAPYRPHQFYREYKPGVDAARLDIATNAQGQISAMAVAGYESDEILGRLTAGEDNEFSYDESSALLRVSHQILGFEAALLGGKLGGFDMAGFSMQGEIGPLGIKGEGHQKNHRQKTLQSAEVALGADYRLTSSTLISIEQLFHGSGYQSSSEYSKLQNDPDRPLYFIGRDYSALGVAHELTPLLGFKGLLIANWTDASALLSTSFVYSLSEDGEFSLSYLMPRGRGAKGEHLRSEYGTYPQILTFETGLYLK